MENLSFYREDRLFKENKLKRVIHSKISNVAENNIQKILQSIDIDKQYYVRATRSPKKFLNTVTEETVNRLEESFVSKSDIIYGECVPGVFVDRDGERSQKAGYMTENKAAAAIKVLKMNDFRCREKVEHYLIIYEPDCSIY